MTRLLGARALLVAALSTLGLGCIGAPIPPPAVPLDPAEQSAVLACQSAISEQVASLSTTAARQFTACGLRALDLRLAVERGLGSTNEFLEKRARLDEKCNQAYARIGRVSTRMINVVLARCQSVESLILGTDLSRGDALARKSDIEFEFGLAGSLPPAANLVDLAGFLCSSAIGTAKLSTMLAFPRTGDLIQRFYGFTDEDDFDAYWRTSVDARCTGGLPGSS